VAEAAVEVAEAAMGTDAEAEIVGNDSKQAVMAVNRQQQQ
jgi:hypothetical protein